MSVLEIVSGVLLLLACVCIVIVCLLQETKQQNMSAITGGSESDSFYGKNGGRTREAKLARFTKISAFALFVITIVVNILAAIS